MLARLALLIAIATLTACDRNEFRVAALPTGVTYATSGSPVEAPARGPALEDDEADVPLGEREGQVPGFVVEPKRANLGSVGHRVERQVEFTVSNKGRDPFDITKLSVSCDCMKAAMQPGRVAPGESRKGMVTIQFGHGFGHFEKYVNIWVRGHELPVKMHVAAQFHPTIQTPSPRAIEVIGVCGVEVPENHAELVLARKPAQAGTDVPLAVSDLRVEGKKESAGMLVVARTNVDAHTVRLRVSLSPQHSEGRVTGTLSAIVEGLPLEITVKGAVYRGIRTKPDLFQFNSIKDPEKALCEIELIPADGRSFQIQGIAIDPPVVTVEQRPRNGGGWWLAARPKPPFPVLAKNERLSAKVIIETDHPDKPKLELRCLGVMVANPSTGQSKGTKP